MADADRLEAYAAALVEIAKGEGTLDRVEDELHTVARTLERNDALRGALTDSAVPIELRQGIVEDLLGPKASPTTTNLVSMVVGAGRGRDLPAIIDKVVAKAADSRAEAVAEVRSAAPLDADQQPPPGRALSSRFRRRVAVRASVDPSLLGGLVVQVGDTVIDGSIRSRLDQLNTNF